MDMAVAVPVADTPFRTNMVGNRPVRIAFRLSSMGFGGAERVFLSVADALSRVHPVEIDFVVDRLGQGETESIARQHGFTLAGLGCSRTIRSIIPLRDYIDTQRPDVLISAYTDTNMAALVSAKLARHRCRVIVTEHASLDEHWQYASLKRRMALNAYVRFGYRLADHVLGVSRGIVKQVRQRLNRPDKVSCIHNPVRFNSTDDAGNAAASARSACATILAVGRIAKPKDYLTLLRAFKIARATLDARLVIVGGVHEHGEKALLDDFIGANGLADRVDFAGYTEHVEAFYRTADLFVMSSAWEGFGNVLVEALAFGLPVVSTNCHHGPSEILSDGRYGTLVPVGDAPALAAAMVAALQTPPPDRETLRRRSRDFSEERIGAQYWGLIEHLMETR